MKTNVKLIESQKRSSWDVTMENLNRLDLSIDDIAGLFYRNNDEYREISYDLADCTKSHSDMITSICLARIFHHRLPSPDLFENPKSPPRLGFFTKLASDLPFCLDVFTTQQPKIPLDVLKRSFETLYSKKSFWQNKTTVVSVKFHLWEFAHTINQAYDKELYIINLDLIEKEFVMDKEANDAFQEMKVDYFHSITKSKAENQEIWKSILSEPDSHCLCH